jgi:hypothetical protein
MTFKHMQSQILKSPTQQIIFSIFMSQVISITLRSLCLVRGVWIDSVTSDHFRQSLPIIEPSSPLQMIEKMQ